jgi:hypothetical protein
MKTILICALILWAPAAFANEHRHRHHERDEHQAKLEQCYQVEDGSFDCDDLDEDQLDEVVANGGADGDD